MARSIPTPITDQIKPDGNNDPETFCQACAERPATLDLSDGDYDRAIAHTEFAAKTLRRAKQAAQDGEAETAGSLTSVAMHHALHAHHALKAAYYNKDGNYLSANRSSTDVAKALCLARVAFEREKGMSGRQGLHWAMQGLAVMRSGLARAKLAEPLEKVRREQRLANCVLQDDRPLATIAKCW